MNDSKKKKKKPFLLYRVPNVNFLTAKLRVTSGSVKDKRKIKQVRALRFMASNEGSAHRDLHSHSSGLSLERKMCGTL